MLRIAEHFQKTDTGRQRPANEDALFARPPLFAVADGMGGARAGEVASGIAARVFEQGLPEGLAPEQGLAQLARQANGEIHALANADAERAGMGTTLTAVHVGERDVALAHVGDSRAYRLRDGELERLTRDHSLVAELVRRGKLTEEEAEDHPQRSVITRALGPEPTVEVDDLVYPARDGDVYLLCSDGLTSMIGEDRILGILRSAGSLAEAGTALVAAANVAGGRDNITVILFRLAGDAGAVDGLTTETTAAHPVVDAGAVGSRDAGAGAAAEERPGDGHRPASAAVADGPAPPSPTARAPRAPRERATAGARRPRRRRRIVISTVAAAAVIAVLALATWVASRDVYFVGTNPQGFITLYRGLPYDGPFGIKLYQRWYVSSAPAIELPPARRDKILDHQFRTQEDAEDLVRSIEEGELAQ